ncbi:MAG: alpha/beta hydrolase [Patescibacteria group bacterium]
MISSKIVINDVCANYYKKGNLNNNIPVFLHGWQSSSLVFKNILDSLENYIAIDLPGFGKSEKPDSNWGLNNYADFLYKFLEKLEITNPILIGHSFGGSIAIKFCLNKHRVKKIFLIDSAGIRQKSIKTSLLKVISKIFKVFFYLPGLNLVKNKVRRKFYQKIDATDYIESGDMKAIYQRIIKEDLTQELKKIKSKVIIIWGAEDKETPLRDADLFNNFINNSELFIIKNAGHFPFLDQPEEFKRIFSSKLYAN